MSTGLVLLSLPRFTCGVQVITATDLERARERGRKLSGLSIGWTHLSRKVTPELAEQALGRIVTVGARSGFRRLGR